MKECPHINGRDPLLEFAGESVLPYSFLAPETSHPVGGEDVVRQRLAEGAEVRLREAVPGGDHVGLVGDTLGALGHAVVGQQLTPPYQGHIAWYEPGENPLIVNLSPVLVRNPAA